MADSPSRHAWVLDKLRSDGARGGGHESAAGAGGEPDPRSLTDSQIDERIHRFGSGLRDYARRWLANDPAALRLIDQAEREGGRGLRMLREEDPSLETDEAALIGLEAVVRDDGSRPSYLIRDDLVLTDSSWCVSKDWAETLQELQPALTKAIQCVGRIDLGGPNPEGPTQALGTGFLVQRNLVVTNRHVLQELPTWRNEAWQASPRYRVWIDFGREHEGRECVRRREVIGVAYAGREVINRQQIDHRKLDLALLELADPPGDQSPPFWLGIATQGSDVRGASDVLVLGYPIDPGKIRDLELIEKLFAGQFGKKRLSPGSFRAPGEQGPGPLGICHDASTLAGNSGSVVLQMTDQRLAGALHYGGLPLRENWAHVLGDCLELPGSRGRTLRQVVEEQGVWLG